ncbi:uncharacterized protein LOC123218124 [Mangifera indica]|uniref:uncharacterized protein LOC123218124 n=1 Tax=Mangifera indica TaxID=29780 RepID=UPI001CFC027F|nr:uncharacterized protein LOC123218124 [Mangifera indica]
MGNETKSSSSTKGRVAAGTAGGGFRSRMDHYLYSGEKKHVFAGIVIISAIFGVPWYLMSRGSKHQSHQDYLERADKARSEHLSSASSSSK